MSDNYFLNGTIEPEEIDQYWVEGALIEMVGAKITGGPTEHMRQQLNEIVMRYIAEGRCIAPKVCARMVLEADSSMWKRRA